MSLANNYAVTFDECATFLTKQTSYPSGNANQCICKSDLLYYFYVQSSYLTGYSDNQLVKYQDIVAQPTYTISFQGRARTSTVAQLWYLIGGNSWTLKTTTTFGTSYAGIGSSITIPQGSTFQIAVTNTAGTNATFGIGNGSGYTGSCGKSAFYYVTPSANTTYYVNINTNVANQPVTC